MTHETRLAPITATDRVSDVLARGDATLEVLVRQSPHFEKLRIPTLRRIMARLTTVEQAARIAGVPVDVLVQDLNHAVGISAPLPPADAVAPFSGSSPAVPADVVFGPHVVDLDVREDLQNGREPFARIMDAVNSLPADGVLHLRAPFEPVPLFAVLQTRGLAHHTEHHADDDWHVWFYRAERAPSEVRLDVRGLEPPEPMTRTLEALERLPDGATLVQVNARVPQFLLPILHERGFVFEVDTTDPAAIEVRIHRARDPVPSG